MIRLGILGSGNGSNFQAILKAIDAGDLKAEIALVLSDNPDARILTRARDRGIPAQVIDCGGYKSKFPLESQQWTAQQLRQAGAELICLAGFMRLVRHPLLEAFPSRILNLHPSLLPNFPGLDAWQQALDAGVEETGCTVHLVDAGMDTGPILAQRKVAIESDDTADSLLTRIHAAEHELYPQAIAEYANSLGNMD
ncbi:MAG: phosphoribosylglycinamide formyltransferase [Verrucomicrobiota bacterium JB023]|nr:phosphoribosylglycinamide formyltransferase [Verrucomicrobiota bacterium JB023]